MAIASIIMLILLIVIGIAAIKNLRSCECDCQILPPVVFQIDNKSAGEFLNETYIEIKNGTATIRTKLEKD